MAQEYYRARIALNPADPDEQKIIGYISGFGDQRINALKELLMLGLEVKEGTVLYSDEDRVRIQALEDEIKHLQTELKEQQKALEEERVGGLEKDRQILELKKRNKELDQDEPKRFTFDKLTTRVIPREKGDEKKARPGRKGDKSKSPMIVKYEMQEQSTEDYTSLEDYVIKKKLDPAVMNMIACAVENRISYRMILSMLENGLTAHQMRGVIDVILAKRQRDGHE